jgi:hypothetical protein
MYIENQGWMERGGGNGNEKVETYGHSHCAIGTQTYGYDADDPRSEIPNVMHQVKKISNQPHHLCMLWLHLEGFFIGRC